MGTKGEVERQNKVMLKELQIAKSEGKTWRWELRKYLAAYRALSHTVTGRSQAELLFNSKIIIRGKIPDLSVTSVHDHELHDKDRKQKAKSKKYAGNHSRAIPSNIQVAKSLWCKRKLINSLQHSSLRRSLFLAKQEVELLLKRKKEGQYCRHTSDVKQFINRDHQPNVTLPEEPQTVSDSVHSSNLQRNLQLPQHDLRGQCVHHNGLWTMTWQVRTSC